MEKSRKLKKKNPTSRRPLSSPTPFSPQIDRLHHHFFANYAFSLRLLRSFSILPPFFALNLTPGRQICAKLGFFRATVCRVSSSPGSPVSRPCTARIRVPCCRICVKLGFFRARVCWVSPTSILDPFLPPLGAEPVEIGGVSELGFRFLLEIWLLAVESVKI